MSGVVQREVTVPIREGMSINDLWSGPDMGLIVCWEQGRRMRLRKRDLVSRVEDGELPVLCWTGGVEKTLKGEKFGSLNYLAMWQGLRGEDLNIDTGATVKLVCTRTETEVTYTGDKTKYVQK